MTETLTAIVIDQDNVDTDALYPGKFLAVVDPQLAREHLFEGLNPGLRDLLKRGPTVLFVGGNFGTGSSREQPVSAMLASGVRAVVGKSFARIFGRNAVNCGLPALTNPDAVCAATHGGAVKVDVESGTVWIAGVGYPSAPVPELPRSIIMAGGLVQWIRARRGPDGRIRPLDDAAAFLP